MSEDAGRERELRAATNQAMFREVNERISDVNDGFASPDAFAVVCECAAPDCVERLELTPAEYEEVRAEADRFIVAPGHVVPEVEKIVAERYGYVVVRKTGAGAEVARQTDPRASH